jgi:hypothetical protein
MGFYPADPSGMEMVFGNMLFDSVRFVQGDGSAVIHKNLTKSSVLKNRPSVQSNDCMLGEDVYYWGYDFPRDGAIGAEQNCLISAPVINSNSEVFKGTQKITISSNTYKGAAQKGAKFYYTLDGSEPDKNAKEYHAGDSLLISQSCLLKVIEADDKGCVSKSATARFYEYSNDYSITYNCVYNKQYTAGGDNGLIDGLKGDIDWRKGRWQGYQGQNFEVIIDLKKVMEIDTVEVGFMEDRRSWIFYPRFVEGFGSIDGVNYESVTAGDYLNTYDKEMFISRDPFLFKIKKSNVRYIKVFAENFGKLPDWHPGAGGDAFIFVDEIEVH